MIGALQEQDASEQPESGTTIPPHAVKVKKLDVQIIQYLKATHTELYTKLRSAVISAIKR